MTDGLQVLTETQFDSFDVNDVWGHAILSQLSNTRSWSSKVCLCYFKSNYIGDFNSSTFWVWQLWRDDNSGHVTFVHFSFRLLRHNCQKTWPWGTFLSDGNVITVKNLSIKLIKIHNVFDTLAEIITSITSRYNWSRVWRRRVVTWSLDTFSAGCCVRTVKYPPWSF